MPCNDDDDNALCSLPCASSRILQGAALWNWASFPRSLPGERVCENVRKYSAEGNVTPEELQLY